MVKAKVTATRNCRGLKGTKSRAEESLPSGSPGLQLESEKWWTNDEQKILKDPIESIELSYLLDPRKSNSFSGSVVVAVRSSQNIDSHLGLRLQRLQTLCGFACRRPGKASCKCSWQRTSCRRDSERAPTTGFCLFGSSAGTTLHPAWWWPRTCFVPPWHHIQHSWLPLELLIVVHGDWHY